MDAGYRLDWITRSTGETSNRAYATVVERECTEMVLIDLPKTIAADAIVSVGAPRRLVVRDADLLSGKFRASEGNGTRFT